VVVMVVAIAMAAVMVAVADRVVAVVAVAGSAVAAAALRKGQAAPDPRPVGPWICNAIRSLPGQTGWGGTFALRGQPDQMGREGTLVQARLSRRNGRSKP
jgi:hypothetical protein